MSLTIVIPTYKRQDVLINLVRYWKDSEFKILILDGSPMSCQQISKELSPNIKYIHSSRNFVPEDSSIIFLDSSKCVCFHDREVKLYGKKYIQKLLNN